MTKVLKKIEISKEEIQKALELMNGKEWTSDRMHRFYFDAESLFDIEYKTYSNGKVYECKINNEKVDDIEGDNCVYFLKNLKVFYNMNTKKFENAMKPGIMTKKKEVTSQIIKKLKSNLKETLATISI